jgi:hypothetical protein
MKWAFFDVKRNASRRLLELASGVALAPSLILAFWISGCASRAQWATRIGWKELSLEEVPGSDAYPEAEALVLLDEGRMELLSGSELQLSMFERHRIVKIFSQAGLRYANVVIAYDPRSRVEAIEARTIAPDGKITVLNSKDIYDVSLYPNYVWYSDQRAKIFTFPAAEVGSILEYRYRMHIRHLTFWHAWSFQELVPVRLSRFTLIGPSEWEVRYRTYGAPIEPQVIKAPPGFKSSYVWEMRDVPALVPEFSMPPLRERLIHLAIAPAGVQNWDDVARWYHDLVSPQLRVPEEMRNLATELTRDAPDELTKLRRLFEWVRDKVRYVAVEIGIGGYQPHPVAEVFRNRYGDCKDMVTLLCSLAEQVGLQVHQAIVSTWHNGPPDTSLPSQLQFNHVIAYCPALDIWMDPTEKGCPFGRLPWYDQGLPVLVVEKDGNGKIVTTPREPPDSNRSEIDWWVNLAADGSASVRGEIRLFGAPASELREQLTAVPKQEWRKWLETSLAKQCSGADLDSFGISGLTEVQDPLRLSFRFTTNSFARRRGEAMVFRPADIAGFDLPEYFRSPHRVHPVRFRFGQQILARMEVMYPPQLEPAVDAWADSVLSEFGQARWWTEKEDGRLRVGMSFSLQGEDVSPERYPEFRQFLDRVRLKNLREILFVAGANSGHPWGDVPGRLPSSAAQAPESEKRKGILNPEHPFRWVVSPSLARWRFQFLQISQ